MDARSQRKEVIRKYKEQKTPAGVFAIRCTPSGQAWVGSTPNLNAVRNRFWFCLRNGSHPDRALQDEWNAHGEESFQYEILETLDDDLPPFGVSDVLKEKALHWLAQLSARRVQ